MFRTEIEFFNPHTAIFSKSRLDILLNLPHIGGIAGKHGQLEAEHMRPRLDVTNPEVVFLAVQLPCIGRLRHIGTIPGVAHVA